MDFETLLIGYSHNSKPSSLIIFLPDVEVKWGNCESLADQFALTYERDFDDLEDELKICYVLMKNTLNNKVAGSINSGVTMLDPVWKWYFKIYPMD